MAKSGTPIRLLREDGDFIELNATKLVLSTDRRFGPKSMPFSGNNRVSIDLNLNKAVILIQGFFSDDEVTTDGSKASATIDFGYFYNNITRHKVCTVDNLNKLYSSDQNNTLHLKDIDGVTRKIFIVVGGSTSYNSSTKTLTIVNTISPADFAQEVKNAIDTSYSSYFTVERVDGEDEYKQILTNSRIIISHVTSGTSGNKSSFPAFTNDGREYTIYPPEIVSKFSGGKNAIRKSAGDKVQDIYSIMNNSSRSTLRAAIWNPLGALFTDAKYGELKSSGSDYIVGIQIPFNSLIEPVGDTYVSKNFFMPTGWLDKDEKSSENALTSGTTFNEANNFTGISGGLKNMEISYDAGEAVYNFDLTFLPSDVLL
jgi:hypothetical protein|tara:strand:- start:403 stop:1512 length:1110 start_codon:yes stop_codon:yes gene_type:complete